VNDVAKRVLARHVAKQGGVDKTAAFPFQKQDPGQLPPPGPPIGNQKRDIPSDHPFDPKSLKPLSKALWASSVGLGHALTAYRYLSRLKSATISPDGLLGGRGYVMPVSQMRRKLYEACEALSNLSDTLYDEIQAPHWKPRLAQLDENSAEDVERFVEESQEVMENPEEKAEEKIKEIEEENDGEKPDTKPPRDDSSQLPGASGSDSPDPSPIDTSTQEKQASLRGVPKLVAFLDDCQDFPNREARLLTVQEIMSWAEPGGPRVDNREPEGGDGPFGSYNDEEPTVDDGWGTDQGTRQPDDYDYQSEWENDLREAGMVVYLNDGTPVDPSDMPSGVPTNSIPIAEARARFGQLMDLAEVVPSGGPNTIAEIKEQLGADVKAIKFSESVMPSDDETETEAWDFGLGYGAHGQGAGGYGNPNSDGKGVLGPQSEVPTTSPDWKSDSGAIDVSLNERHGECGCPSPCPCGNPGDSTLPGDDVPPVARSDYYYGPGGGPTLAQSELPAEATPTTDTDMSMVDTFYHTEDVETPYVRFDDSTREYKDDPLHDWPQKDV